MDSLFWNHKQKYINPLFFTLLYVTLLYVVTAKERCNAWEKGQGLDQNEAYIKSSNKNLRRKLIVILLTQVRAIKSKWPSADLARRCFI